MMRATLLIASGVTIGIGEVPVFVGMGMPAEADRIWMGPNRAEEILHVDRVVRRVGGSERLQRDMETDHHQAVAWHVGQDVANEAQLAFSKVATVFAEAVRFGRISAEVIDVVQQDEGRPTVLEGVPTGAEDPLEGFGGVGVVRSLQIHVVVAAAVEPRQPNRADDVVIPRLVRQVVEHDVAMGNAERRL